MKENRFSTSWQDKVVMEGLAKFTNTVEEGASTQVLLAAADLGASDDGKYFLDGKPKKPQAFVMDRTKGEELWAISEDIWR